MYKKKMSKAKGFQRNSKDPSVFFEKIAFQILKKENPAYLCVALKVKAQA
jgi:hypothetical protein